MGQNMSRNILTASNAQKLFQNFSNWPLKILMFLVLTNLIAGYVQAFIAK